MKIHRFIGAFDLSKDQITVADPEIAHQIHTVLKLEKGERVVLCDGTGAEAVAELVSVEPTSVAVRVLTRGRAVAEPTVSVTLYCAILKSENFELVAQKATEAGVTTIVPVVTKRTVKLGLKQDRLERIVREAAEQSGRGVVPKVMEPMKLEVAVERSPAELKLFFDAGGELFTPATIGKVKSVAVFIGPEGGWDPSELEQAGRYGCRVVSMGELILRGETAAIIATYLASHA